MAANAYLSIKAVKQGDIKPTISERGKEGKIPVFAVSHELISPRDSASGLASGKRQHKPLVITKELDTTTPMLYQALITNEQLIEVNLEFWSEDERASSFPSTKEPSFIIKLTNAGISGIKKVMMNNKIAPGEKLPVLEEVSFIYQRIIWESKTGKRTTVDDWNTTQ